MSSSTLKANHVSPLDSDSLNRFLSGMASGFSSTRISRAFITEIDNTAPPYPSPSITPARLLQHISPRITDSAHHGAELVEAGDFSALAVWEPPHFSGTPFADSIKNVGPIREGWRADVKRMKEAYVGTTTHADGTKKLKPFYHLDFLVRNPDVPRVKGAISAVVRPYLERAEREGVAVWLEATYQHAVEVYLHLGFRLCETVRVGIGRRDEEGVAGRRGSGR